MQPLYQARYNEQSIVHSVTVNSDKFLMQMQSTIPADDHVNTDADMVIVQKFSSVITEQRLVVHSYWQLKHLCSFSLVLTKLAANTHGSCDRSNVLNSHCSRSINVTKLFTVKHYFFPHLNFAISLCRKFAAF